MDIPHYIALSIIGGLQVLELGILMKLATDVASIRQAVIEHSRRINRIEDKIQ